MRATSLIDLVYLAGTFVLIWWGATRLWPEVVRARLRAKVVEVRNQLIDAVLDGHIDRSELAFRAALGFCRQLTEHPETVSISRAIAAHRAMERAGLADEIPDTLPSLATMSSEGRRIMLQVDAVLNKVLAQYLIQGSRWWWALGPYWALHERFCKHPDCCNNIAQPMEPTRLAADFRAQAAEEAANTPSVVAIDALPAFC